VASDQTRNLNIEHQDERKERRTFFFSGVFWGTPLSPFSSDHVSLKIGIVLGYFCRISKSLIFSLLGALNIKTKDATAKEGVY